MLRRATPEDAEALSALASTCYIQTFGQLYSSEDLDRFITCTPTNARFYSSAGYRVVGEHSVSLDGNDVPVWSFEKDIE